MAVKHGLLFICVLSSMTLGNSPMLCAQPGLPAQVQCNTAGSTDQDHDGLSDACELELARVFAPMLVVRQGRCNWDSAGSRLAGGYFFAVQPVDSVVRIAYLPAYFHDCGWSGFKCLLPWVNCSSHNGDSEFMVVEVRQDSPRSIWRVSGVFLSAHCFGRSPSSCRWYRGSDLALFEWSSSAPVLWVAEGRNANYPSRRSCDRGHHSVDTCDHNDYRFSFPIIPDRNIGSRAAPHYPDGCYTGAYLQTSGVDPTTMECFWRADASFRGWQRTGAGVTGYYRYLMEIAGF